MKDDVIGNNSFINTAISDAVYRLIIKSINRHYYLDIELRDITSGDDDEFFLDDGTKILAGNTKYVFSYDTTVTELAGTIDMWIHDKKPRLIVYRGSILIENGFEINIWLGN